MLKNPQLVKGYSGVFQDMETIILALNDVSKESFSVLEKYYRPKHIYKVIRFDALKGAVEKTMEKYNVIIHTDDKKKLTTLKNNQIFGYRLKNVGLSTGMIS